MFKEFIAQEILNFPTLFFKNDYKKSEMAVLDHVFFVIGNGFEWKDGYPLLPSGTEEYEEYKPVDIDKFFALKDSIYMLDITDHSGKTLKHIDSLSYKLPVLKEFPSDSYIFIKDKDIAERYNADKAVRRDNDTFGVDIFDRINEFEKLTDETFVDYISFYELSGFGYSMIEELSAQPVIQKETVEYALKALDYAEEFYKDPKKFQKLPKGYRSLGFKKEIDSKGELKKIRALRKEIKKLK